MMANIHITEDIFQGYHKVVADLVLKYTSEKGRVLDIGCGFGHTLRLVRRQAPLLELHAADISRESLEITKDRVFGVRVFLMGSEGFDVSCLEKGYDTCVMSHSLEHMLYPLEAIRKVMSIVNHGGHLILAVPNPVRPAVIVGNLFQHNYVNKGHACAWDRAHWINFLENIAKLKVAEYCSDEVRFFPRRLSRRLRFLKSIERRVSLLFPWFSASNIAVVKKTSVGTAASKGMSVGDFPSVRRDDESPLSQ
jgi:2-polyprenyl-3-methyl-5-hydroxy-6-metoxy-1,4-benzoquinol methylase